MTKTILEILQEEEDEDLRPPIQNATNESIADVLAREESAQDADQNLITQEEEKGFLQQTNELLGSFGQGATTALETPLFAMIGATGEALNMLDQLNPNVEIRPGDPLIKFYEDAMRGNKIVEEHLSEDFEDRVMMDIGSFVGDSMLFAGVSAGAAKATVQNFVTKKSFERPIAEQLLLVDEFARAPAKAAAVEISTGAGAGAGFSFMEEYFPESPTAQAMGAIAGGAVVGSATALISRVGPFRPDFADKIVDDAIATTKSGRLPGKTAQETIEFRGRIADTISEPSLRARDTTDAFLIRNRDAAAGPLFTPDDFETRLRAELKETGAPDEIIEDNVKFALGEIERGNPQFRGIRQPDAADVAANKLNKRLDSSIDASIRDKEKFVDKFARSARDLASLKRDQLGKLGIAGRDAEIEMSLQRGARPKAEFEMQQYRKEIFQGLTEKNNRILTKYIANLRGAQVENARPSINQARKAMGEKPQGPFIKGFTEQDFVKAAKDNLAEAGPVIADDIDIRAMRYFGAFRTQLKKLRTEGLIGDDEFKRLERFIYTPKEFIEHIDPVLDNIVVGNKTISVTSSGIKRLEGGGPQLLRLSPEEQLAEAVVRTESRIARNRVGKSLEAIAINLPDNDYVSKKQVEKTWVRFTAREIDPDTKKAKNIAYYAEPELAKVLLEDNAGSGKVGNIMSWMTGTRITKALVTGANPTFVLRQFPRDIMFAITTSGQYERFLLPKALGQISLDLAAVSRDAIKRQGLFEDYIKQGGGMNFLSHSARLNAIDNIPKTALGANVRDAMRDLTYINETSEIMVRLAVMRRAMRNGASEREAVFIARDYLDFSDGSQMTKVADSIIPYINVAFIATRNVLRAAKKDPAQVAAVGGQLLGTYALTSAWAQIADPEMYADLSPRIKESNIILPIGTSRLDAEGNVRHGYIAIPVEQTTIPLKKAADTLMESYIQGEVPPIEVLSMVDTGLKAFAPTGAMPPTFAAFGALQNVDATNWSEVWTKSDVEFQQEIEDFPEQDPTSGLARDLGLLSASIGLGDLPISSPERIEAIAKSHGVGQNDYSRMLGGAYGLLREVVTGEDLNPDMAWQQQVQLFPNLRLYKETSPVLAVAQDLIEQEREANTEEAKARRVIDKEVALNVTNSAEAQSRADVIKQAAALGRNVGPFEGALTQKMVEYATNRFETDRIWRNNKVSPQFSGRQQEVAFVSTLDARVRAEWWMEELDKIELTEDRNERSEKRRFLALVRGNVSGFNSNEFNGWLARLKKEERDE